MILRAVYAAVRGLLPPAPIRLLTTVPAHVRTPFAIEGGDASRTCRPSRSALARTTAHASAVPGGRAHKELPPPSP
ncbi:hypothetical protein C8R44DRAFT_864363 [Mycena epipterygia]|nr:hypothetical protein C8R44DRAFT_864363 [Mycena epipterygia]